MIVRGLDSNGDFTYGRGKNNYYTLNKAIGQDIETRLASFLGDCFFATGDGIDWFNLLGGKDQVGLNLALRAVLLNTANMTGVLEVSTNLDENRKISVSYDVTTSYGRDTETFQFDFS